MNDDDTEKIKILLITPDIYPFQRGYGGRNPIQIYNTLTSMGYIVKIIASVPDNELDQAEIKSLPKNVEILTLNTSSILSKDFSYLLPPHFSEIKRLRSIFLHEKYDLVILNDFIWSLSFLSIILMGKMNRKKTIMINHGIITRRKFLFNIMLNFFNAFMSRVILTDFVGIISYSNKSFEELNELLPRGMMHVVHPLCIDIPKFVIDYKNSFINSSLDTNNKFGIYSEFIFSIGTISYHKGYIVLIKAFHSLLNIFPNIILVIAGNITPYTEELIDFSTNLGIASKVRFIGAITDSEKFFLMRSCTVFVVPSLKEGFGASAMEADVLEIKIVATDTGAHREILSGNKFARISEPGNENDLYKAIIELTSLLDTPSKRLNVEKLDKYSCDSLCSFIISIYKKTDQK